MLEKIYDQSKDLFVANYLIYGDSTDQKLYYSDEEDKVQVSEADLKDAFLKGRLVICTSEGVFEVAVKINGNKAYTVGASGLVEYLALAD